MSKAVAFIEADGMVAIFDAVDAMVKATEVTVEGTMRLGGGVVAVSLSGDLATVEEAAEVGVAAAKAVSGSKVNSVIFASPSVPVAAVAANPSLIDG
ncbi:BMC domain-containing protein [Actinocorallia sp. A-T 12471]|uniref:BMC domain-containing protein n=1 Tax=Actinocorallia sp. A-T 12471 TaxID=3089813 RepID=UPI0029CBB599|nr:BMC domain-containing protein [Actinocorallia sp. A-T 12471]MDX6742764.1 BMC domain-containing protein [Actinocorallia sp. A-T 12471]